MGRFNIPLGMGDKTIEDVCKSHGIHSDLFCIVLNSLCDKDFVSNEKVNSFYAIPIIDYLTKAYSDFKIIQTKNIERHINRLSASAQDSNSTLHLLSSLFNECTKELEELIKFKESTIFPYILYVYELFHSPEYSGIKEIKNISKSHKFGSEYLIIIEKLNDLLSLMIKYLQEEYDENIFYGVIKIGRASCRERV